MAPGRRARSPADNDTDNESGQETPRPQRLKKRVSEVIRPLAGGDDDGSFNNGEGRVPFRSVNINDDAAEKRRRRKSTKLNVIENALAGPSNENGQVDQQAEGAGTSRAAVAAGKQKQQLNTVAAPVINVQLDINNAKFEEWMKMATDNKINAANSWNFALIDYFHDMSLLRNNDDNSINFQRASCTLEGCVKIWTSRVDSVGTETGKLLSNLESGGTNNNDDDNDSDNPDGEPSQTKTRKARERGPGATLVKDPSQLKNKKLDLEFAVDPLFRKMCADFDEGGAGGLLMNHLSLGIGSEGCMRVIFDRSDSMGTVEEENMIEEPEDEVNLSYLRKQFMPDLASLEDLEIAPSLASFSFTKSSLPFDDTMFVDNTHSNLANLNMDDDDEGTFNFDSNFDAGPMSGDGNAGPEDFFVGPDAVNEDFGMDFGGGDDNDNHSDAGSMGGSAGQMGEGGGAPGPFVPFDPRRMPNDRDLVLAMADGEGGALDYFDQNVMKNWAGPEHWKLRRVIRKTGTDETKDTKTKRTKKEAVKIDFTTPREKELKQITAELFAGVTKGAGINLPSTKKGKKKGGKEKKDDHRLPDDMHFSSKQLVTLFLKPKFFLKMRGRRAKLNEGDGEVDEAFWAQAAAENPPGHDPDNDDMNAHPAPFATQFFNDDEFGPGFDDDGGFDNGFETAGGMSMMQDEDSGEQDLLAATQGMKRRVRPEAMKYARRAKRVDVRKLKDNIWQGLGIVLEKEEDEEQSMDVDNPEDEQPTDPSEARQFSQVITGLQKSYPRDKMEEISTSFCFICLLHLANEQGLKLESTVKKIEDDDEGMIDDMEDEETVEEVKPVKGDKKIVGDIWDINIYRDPTATKSA
ncbi:condensin complex subunit 2/barren [Crepidotus variabilis]|uniref:Condensin complex subunit 2 n=1 Tax=Crepidotus variabilis TaxID=179855 RepID=A0A9P6EB44_9AGAR|nr:condensin complex subunit 2/barren [Crepidotus variabilis]